MISDIIAAIKNPVRTDKTTTTYIRCPKKDCGSVDITVILDDSYNHRTLLRCVTCGEQFQLELLKMK